MASYNYTFQSGDTLTPTKLNDARTVSEIVNADIKSDAAIAGTKIAPNFGSQDITVSGSNRSITNTGNFALSFGTNNTTRVTIPAAGGMNVIGRVSASDDTFSGFTMTSAATTGNAELLSNRSRGTLASPAIVQSGDNLMLIAARGYDGTTYRNAAFITGFVGGTPGSGDMPGALSFSTTADGSATPTERMRINASGNVGIGNTNPAVKLDVTGDINCSEAYGVDGVQVVANRRTGWTAATGTATRTTFATSTVTTAQLAERVKALIDDLSFHGLIGS